MTQPPRNPDSLAEDARWITTILSGGEATEREECYRKLMRKYWKVIAVIAASKVADPREAEDVTQEAFIRAFRSLEGLSEPVAFLGWILRIAKNLATDRLRGRRAMVSLDALGDRAEELAGFRERSIAQDPSRSLEADEDAAQAMKALQDLPEKYREVVTLRYLEGLDGKSMARILGEPEGTVRNRLFRALEKLRQSLQQGKAHKP